MASFHLPLYFIADLAKEAGVHIEPHEISFEDRLLSADAFREKVIKPRMTRRGALGETIHVGIIEKPYRGTPQFIQT